MDYLWVKGVVKAFTALVILTGMAFGLFATVAHAENAPAYTYTISEYGRWVRTQDAYLTSGLLFRDTGLKKPEDIFVKNGKIYVADSGGNRIAIMDLSTNEVTFLGEELLSSPTGVFVDEQGNILVADYGLEKVILLSEDGRELKSYGRPDSPLFGKKTNYKPRKALSDKKGNIYIVGEGTYDGIIQLSKEGEFLGYFGANTTNLSPLEALQEIIFTEEQKEKLFKRIPKVFYNLAIDNKGMTYTITQGVRGHAIKKHNVSGSDVLSPRGRLFDEDNFVDITIGNYGQIYALTETGLIYEYDSSGAIVFSFGGRAISTERNGLFTVSTGIAVDEDNYIYVLDKERGIVQVFFPTIFADMTHRAINLFESGNYAESKALWQQILQLSGTARMAHNGLGKAYFQESDFEKAAYHFKIAQNRADYSESFWEIRNKWLQDNSALMIILIVCFFILSYMLKKIDAKKGIFDPFRRFGRMPVKHKLIRDLVFLRKILRHPIDSMYEIRRDRAGSVLSATILYLAGFVIFAFNFMGRGFIFNYIDARNVSYVFIMALFLLPCAIFVAANYMVSSINEGEGRLKDVYTATAYSLAPFIVFMPFIIALSYVVTLNEAFILSFASLLIWVWVAIILFLGLKEIHNYEVKEVVKNILLSLFLMFVAVILYSIIYMLLDQLVGFVYSVVKEVAYNVGR